MTGVKWWVMFLCEHKKSDCVAAKEHETSRESNRESRDVTIQRYGMLHFQTSNKVWFAAYGVWLCFLAISMTE